MSKTKKGVGAWLSEVFGSSYKAISEKLSTEEHEAFVSAAGALQPTDSEGDDDDEPDDDDDEQEEQADDAPQNTTLEARLTALEQSLRANQTALKAEKKTNKTLTSKVTELEGKLKASEAQKAKLRQAVNPLGDEDLTNRPVDEQFLTKADKEARENYRRKQEADA